MKQLIVLMGLLCYSLVLPSQSIITPKLEATQNKKWTFGLQAGQYTQVFTQRSLQIGGFIEYRISPLLALESELSYDVTKAKHSIFSHHNYKTRNIDFALSLKFYFGKMKLWYGKIGFYQKINLSSNYLETAPVDEFPNGFNLANEIGNKRGLQYGLGRKVNLKNGHMLKIEGLLRQQKRRGVFGGIKVGYSF